MSFNQGVLFKLVYVRRFFYCGCFHILQGISTLGVLFKWCGVLPHIGWSAHFKGVYVFSLRPFGCRHLDQYVDTRGIHFKATHVLTLLINVFPLKAV